MKKDSAMTIVEKMERIGDVWREVNRTTHPNAKKHLQDYYTTLLDTLEAELANKKAEISEVE